MATTPTNTNSVKSSILAKLPADLTPAQRARLKLYSHIFIIVLFNAVLLTIAFLTRNNGVINWQLLLTSVASQAALAGLDALKKFLSAQGDTSYAAIVDMVENEIRAANPPTIALSANEQVLTSTVDNLLMPAATPVVSSAPTTNPAVSQVAAAPQLAFTNATSVATSMMSSTPETGAAGVKPASVGIPDIAPSSNNVIANQLVDTLPIITALPDSATVNHSNA